MRRELRSGRPHIYHAELFAPVIAERRSLGLNVFDLPKGLTLVSQWFGIDPPSRFGADEGAGNKRSNRWGMGGYGEGGMSGAMGGGGGFGLGGGGLGGGAGPDDGQPNKPAHAKEYDPLDIVSAIRDAVDQTQSQDLVRIKIPTPVSLRSGRSAALPVFAEQLPGAVVSLISFDGDRVNVWRMIELKNNTSSSLIAGPVSVILDGQFVGDGLLDRLGIQSSGNIIYGADRSVAVTHSTTNPKRTIKELRRQANDLEIVYREHYEARLEIRNGEAERRPVVVKYPKPKDRFRIEDPHPDRTENEQSVYVMTLKPQSTERLKLTIARDQEESTPLDHTPSAELRTLLGSSAKVTDDLRTFVAAVIELTGQLEARETELTELRAAKTRLMEEQQRTRQNLQAISRTFFWMWVDCRRISREIRDFVVNWNFAILATRRG